MIKLLNFSFPYDAYLHWFYARNPGLDTSSFDTQDAELKSDFFPGCSDGWTTALQLHGYNTRDHVLTASSAQQQWAKEHGINYRVKHWQWDIAREQVIRFQPTVLAVDPYSVPVAWLQTLKREVTSIRAVLCRYSSPKQDLSRFRLADIVVSGDTDQVEQLRQLGIDAHHHHHGFDERILRKLPARGAKPRIYFAGQLYRFKGFHLYRTRVLDELASRSLPIELRLLGGTESGWQSHAKNHVKKLLWYSAEYLGWRGVQRETMRRIPLLRKPLEWPGPPPPPLPQKLLRLAQPATFGIEMYGQMRHNLLTLNVHGDVSVQNANNLRLWETTGVGSCLLTDSKRNLKDLFEIDEEIVAFGSPEDCRERAEWLLKHPDEAELIAKRGQRRTLREHTYAARAHELNSIIRSHLAGASKTFGT